MDIYISILRDFLNLGFEYYWVGRKITPAKLSRGTDGKIVKEIYDKLENF
ncbi:hypothetical protein IJH24_03595 [Candidatus Saccharibacteria bacterium]|nr:hypothetical protein [Candidatus Saccharibacteria bacterium]